MALALLLAGACKKDKGEATNCNSPYTNVPGDVQGNWVNGFSSFTQVIDAYDGRILGHTWQSGRYLHLEADGRNAEMFIMGGTMYSEFATKLKGSVTFDEQTNSFQFHVCYAHYKGWQNGKLTVDRDATPAERDELTGNLHFYYGFANSGGNTWLQLLFVSDPNGSPSSFRAVN